MSDITDDPTSDATPLTTTPPLRKVGGVVIPSKTWVPFVAGAVGGMSGAVLTAPLDVVKTRLQSDFYKERLQAVKKVGKFTTTRIGVWGHLVDTGAIIRYKRWFVLLMVGMYTALREYVHCLRDLGRHCPGLFLQGTLLVTRGC
jgi:hypothetical protein